MKLTIRIHDDTWAALRAMSVLTGQSINSLVAVSLDAAIPQMLKRIDKNDYDRVLRYIRQAKSQED